VGAPAAHGRKPAVANSFDRLFEADRPLPTDLAAIARQADRDALL